MLVADVRKLRICHQTLHTAITCTLVLKDIEQWAEDTMKHIATLNVLGIHLQHYGKICVDSFHLFIIF